MQINKCKLGYGGTKSEMERLLADAQKLSGVKYNISNLNDVYEAIHVVQKELKVSGISAEEAAEMVAAGLMTQEEAFEAMGTTAKEAATTFSGSFASMQAAASNVLANLTLGEDISPALDALSETVFTFIGGNLLPMMGNIFSGLPDVLQASMSMAIQGLNLAANNAGEIVKEGAELVAGFGVSIISAAPYLVESGVALVGAVGRGILDTDWKQVAKSAINDLRSNLDIASCEIFGSDKSIIEAVASSIKSNLPEMVDAAGDMIDAAVDYIMSDGLPMVWDVGTDVALSLVDGAIDRAPKVAGAALNLCGRFLGAVAENLPEFLASGIAVTGKLVAGLIKATPEVVAAAWEIALNIKDKFLSYNWAQLGKDILAGIAKGIYSAVGSIITAVKDAARRALSGAKDALEIRSPSRKFQNEVGAQIPAGIAVGVEKNSDAVKSAMRELSDYAQTSFDTSLSVKGSMSFATSGSAPVEAQSDSVVTLMRDLLDSNLQAYERIIYLLELLLEAILNIDIGGDTITKLITDYQRKVAVVKGG